MYVEYTLEIVPNSEAPIKSKMYQADQHIVIQRLGSIDRFPIWKYKETFYGVEFPKATESSIK